MTSYMFTKLTASLQPKHQILSNEIACNKFRGVYASVEYIDVRSYNLGQNSLNLTQKLTKQCLVVKQTTLLIPKC